MMFRIEVFYPQFSFAVPQDNLTVNQNISRNVAVLNNLWQELRNFGVIQAI